MSEGQVKQALVLSGGGARAAYQVGALRHIARTLPEYRPQIITGVSAGAINAAHLAASPYDWPNAIEMLRNLWLSLDTAKVYDTELRSMLKRIMVWGLRLISGGRLGRADLRGMVDNDPLRAFLTDVIPNQGGRLDGIQQNLDAGVLESLALVTTSYGSGRSVAWVESAQEALWQAGQLVARKTDLSIEHVMASAALPMFFPAVKLDSVWHGDGGMRLTAPLSPAMHLGATRILAVSPRARPIQSLPPELREPYPSPAQIAGVMLNAIFLDMLDFDALQMSRINQLVQAVPEDSTTYRNVEVMVLRPREDLGELARHHELELPRTFRFFEGGLNDRKNRQSDALSMVIFEPAYLSLLMRLGEEDAAARSDEIVAFLRGESVSDNIA